MKVFALLFLVAAVSAIDDLALYKSKNGLPPMLQVLNDMGLMPPQSRTTGRIVGGVPAPIEDFPYQLNLRQNAAFICGASVITPSVALSAAHCLDAGVAPGAISFRAGSADRGAGGSIHTASSYVLHGQYNPSTLRFDVAVATVSTNFVGPNIAIIPIVPEGLDTAPGTRAIVSGWGLTATGALPFLLQQVDIPIVSQAQCVGSWGGLITVDMICAGELGRDSCNGDSGGPLVANGLQVGIVSWGAQACGGAAPGVYVRIAEPSIRSFISTNAGV